MSDDSPLIATSEVRPDEVELFMFSAATWLTHRIHFDRDYARSEGFPDLVVHGPLQGAYLAEMLSSTARRYGGRLSRLSYRHHRSVFCGDRLILAATLASRADHDGGVALESDVHITTDAGDVATSGTALLWLPDPESADTLLDRARAVP